MIYTDLKDYNISRYAMDYLLISAYNNSIKDKDLTFTECWLAKQ